MIAFVHKIHPNKYSRNGNIFTRIEFMSDEGKWFKTDVCQDYRNYSRWIPVIEAGVGTKLDGLQVRNDSEVNGDSYPKIIGKGNPALVGTAPVEKKEEPKPEQQSLI
jgi:hypothetical protein